MALAIGINGLGFLAQGNTNKNVTFTPPKDYFTLFDIHLRKNKNGVQLMDLLASDIVFEQKEEEKSLQA